MFQPVLVDPTPCRCQSFFVSLPSRPSSVLQSTVHFRTERIMRPTLSMTAPSSAFQRYPAARAPASTVATESPLLLFRSGRRLQVPAGTGPTNGCYNPARVSWRRKRCCPTLGKADVSRTLQIYTLPPPATTDSSTCTRGPPRPSSSGSDTSYQPCRPRGSPRCCNRAPRPGGTAVGTSRPRLYRDRGDRAEPPNVDVDRRRAVRHSLLRPSRAIWPRQRTCHLALDECLPREPRTRAQ